MAYLKKVDDATNNPGAGPGDGWFKISEVGYENSMSLPPASLILRLVNKISFRQRSGVLTNWYVCITSMSTTRLLILSQIEAEGIQTVTIPECIEDGDYLLRFELIALHSASAPLGAQFYVNDSRPPARP